MMTKQRYARILTYSFLGGAAGLTFLLPGQLTVPVMMATTPPDQIVLTGLARDFLEAHVDFGVVPNEGLGHYAGNVSQLLGPDGRPLQVHGVSDFTINFGSLVPGVPYAARATVLGAEITSGGNPVPVTIKAETDTDVYEPYGSYDDPGGTGSVNDNNNPRHHVFSLDAVYSADTPISITATSWLENATSTEFGHHVNSGSFDDNAKNHQIATRFTLPVAGTVTSLTALIETDEDDPYPVVYAIYDDDAGTPGGLVVESGVGMSPDDTTWYTLNVAPTWLAAGEYWLALGMDHDHQNYMFKPGGDSRRIGHDAASNGFQGTWGNGSSSGSSEDITLCMFASLTPDAPTFAEHMTVRSGDDSPYVKVLKDGDAVPSIPAFQNQSNLADFVEPYIDVDSGLVTLKDNEAIYLFELGTTNLSSPSADFQDLVIMVTLATDPAFFLSPDTVADGHNPIGFKVDAQWTDSAGRNVAPHLYKPSLGDSGGISGVTASGGVTSPATFYEWHRDILGTNQSTAHDIVLTKDAFNVYEFTTNAFYPVDGKLYGNEGQTHNHNFTYSMQASFTYDESANQFFEFQGGDGAFLFVNGKLAIDLGGVQPGVSQYADANRLGLTDGQTYDVQLFYANRNPASADFSFRTNVALNGGELLGSVTAAFD